MTDPIVQAFLEEADDRLAELEEDLLRLEQSPSEPEIVNRIFRCAHTLKGNSRMLGFEDIARFTHSLEDLLDQLRKQLRIVTPDIVDVLLMSGDVLKQLVGVARGTESPNPDVSEGVLHLINNLLSGSSSGGAAASTPVSAHSPSATLHQAASNTASPAANAPSAPVASAPPAAVSTEPAPRADEPKPASAPKSTESDAFFGFFDEPAPSASAASPASAPLPPAAPTNTNGSTQPPAPAPNTPAAPTEAKNPALIELAKLAEPLSVPPKTNSLPKPEAPRAPLSPEQASIRVPVEKVDRLINLVGELVITQSIIAQTVDHFTPDRIQTLQEAVAQMDRHARELHERMMAVRMVPIKSLFARFPRLVRDLAGMTGKQVALETSGEDTELDKTVIERISDPLTHLLRNAVDHGVETPAERKAGGKNETSHVKLKAYQRGGNIYIEVQDDGKGIDKDRVRAKAVATGLVAADAQLTDEQIVHLIFKPGLSTAAKVTEVSGRGVGMDVVKKNIEALGGVISIKTEKGKGTLFQIKLPLTLAIMDGQTMRVGQQIFVVPLVSITESVRPSRESVHRPAGAPALVMIRGQALPMLALHELLGVEPEARDPHEGLLVVVENEGRLAGLLVDELLGQQQVVVKNLETNFKKTEGITGATILGDGRVALILDIPGVVELARRQELVRAC